MKIKHSIFNRILLIQLLVTLILVTIFGRIIIAQVDNKILNDEFRYQTKVLAIWQQDLMNQLKTIKSASIGMFKEDISGSSVLNRMLTYQPNVNLPENLKNKTAAEDYLYSIASSMRGVSSVYFFRQKDGEVLYYKKNSGSISTELEQFVYRHKDFRKDNYMKLIPNPLSSVKQGEPDPLLSVFVRINDVNSAGAYEQAGTMVVMLDPSYVNDLSEDLKGVRTIEFRTDYGVVYYPEVSGKELSSGAYLQVMSNDSSGVQLSSWVSKAQLQRESASIRFMSWGVLGLLLLLTLSASIYLTRKISSRLSVIVRALKRSRVENFSERINIVTIDEFTEIEETFNMMIDRLQEDIRRQYVFQIEAKNVEIRSLQAQINPHFLSNTLEIFRMHAMKNNNNQLSDMLFDLSEYFRWNMRNRDTLVPIYEEFHYLELYMRLQISKLPNTTYAIHMDEHIGDCVIAKFCIQPLIENIFIHAGFSEQQEGHIDISVRGEEGQIFIRIRDNGRGMDPEILGSLLCRLEDPSSSSGSSSIGIANVYRRLKLLFDEAFHFCMHSEPGSGTEVLIAIPQLMKS